MLNARNREPRACCLAFFLWRPASPGTLAVPSTIADSLWRYLHTGARVEPARTSRELGAREHAQNLARIAVRENLAGGRFGAAGLMIIRASDSSAVRAELAGDSASVHGVFAAEISVWRTVYEGMIPAR